MMYQPATQCTIGDHPHRVAPRLVLALLISFSLIGCETISSGGGAASPARAERLADRGQYGEAASAYMALAGQAAGVDRDRYLLQAADAWINDGDDARAARAIDQVANPSASELGNRWYVTRARLANARGDGQRALDILAAAEPTEYNLRQRISAEAARADALFLIDQPGEAIEVLQRREVWLGSSDEIRANHELIWDGLLSASPQALRDAASQTNDASLRGWLELGLLADGSLPGGPARGLAGWQRQFGDHPALRFIVPGLSGDTALDIVKMPEHIAVLLTLSGRGAPIGEAVRDGFLAHYAERNQGRIDAPEVRFYDVGEQGATLAYQQAMADGATFVVGPLLRSPVDELAGYAGARIPTLLLNYLPDNALPDPLLFQFGLAPEDEAAAIARRAIAEGHRRAVAFVPASSWGERVLAAFNDAFVSYGGELLTYQTYLPEETDYKDEIQTAMLLNDSVSRYRTMRSTLGGTLQFEPRRRADTDFIFIAANNASARQLRPQFRFHYAGDLPVYATSAVYNTNRQESGSDLADIRFADIPWLVDELRGAETPLDELALFLASARTQPRLVALGYDAFAAIELIVQSAADQPAKWSGATGELTLTRSGQIRRLPDFATFERATPVALPTIELPEIPGLLDVPVSAPQAID